MFLVRSKSCNQDIVNLAVGAWWLTTTMVSLVIVRNMPYYDQLLSPKSDLPTENSQRGSDQYSYFYDGEMLLEDDHTSPVGFRVPSLPNFEIDPALANNNGNRCISQNLLFAIGILLTAAIGSGLIYLSFTTMDEEFFLKLDIAAATYLGSKNDTSMWP
jgi:hypothetical protein